MVSAACTTAGAADSDGQATMVIALTVMDTILMAAMAAIIILM